MIIIYNYYIMNTKYVPNSLSESDKKKQIKSIKNKTIRPKLQSSKSRRSPYVKQFEKKYGFKITDKKVNQLIKPKGKQLILDKGKGAYFSSGSRPNQTPQSWAYARLASVLMDGDARKIDKDIYNKYKV